MRTQYTELKLIEEGIHMAENALLSIDNPSDAVLSALDFLDDVLCGLSSEKLLGGQIAVKNDGSWPVMAMQTIVEGRASICLK
jgi:hypothetical protein